MSADASTTPGRLLAGKRTETGDGVTSVMGNRARRGGKVRSEGRCQRGVSQLPICLSRIFRCRMTGGQGSLVVERGFPVRPIWCVRKVEGSMAD